MSLISMQNFVAPFKNTTHIITIVLIAVLVAAFRYSGGSVQMSSKPVRSSAVAPLLPDAVESDEETIPASTRKEILNQMIGDDTSEQSETGAKKDLIELQKKLGLR